MKDDGAPGVPARQILATLAPRTSTSNRTAFLCALSESFAAFAVKSFFNPQTPSCVDWTPTCAGRHCLNSIVVLTLQIMSDLTREIIGAAITIHRKLGPGLLESAYEACLAYELEQLDLKVERQKAVPLVYEAVKLDCGFRADLVVNGRVVVEIKAKEALHPVDEAQLLSHLRLLNIPVGSSSTSTLSC